MTPDNLSTPAYNECRAREQTHVCAQCGGILATLYNEGLDDYESVCGNHHEHRGFRRKLIEAENFRRGELDKVAGTGMQAAIEKAFIAYPQLNPLMPREDVATRAPLTAAQIRMLQEFAADIGLKYHLGHICLYQGRPYITIDGYYYLKTVCGLAFAVRTQPMTADQRAAHFVGEGDHAYLAEAITAGGDVLNRGIGIVTAVEMSSKSARNPDQFRAPVLHNKPQVMAEKRAEWQLLQKMIPLGVGKPMPQRETLKPAPSKPATREQIDELYPG